MSEDAVAALREARAVLGLQRLVFGIHDTAFPMDPDEDLGCGSPGSRGAAHLLEWLRDAGFDGVQLGPSGQTSAGNASPYDSTWFSRNECTVPIARLTDEEWCGLLDRAALRELVRARAPSPPERTRHREAFALHERALDRAHQSLREREDRPAAHALAAQLETFARQHGRWLSPMELFRALELEHGGAPVAQWPELDRALADPPAQLASAAALRERALRERHARALQRYRFGQFVAHREHDALRARAARLGLALYADAQIGCAAPDHWAHAASFLEGYRLGAPPSRTTPDGQPWDYPVLHPDRRCAAELLAERMDKLFAEHDAVRIDHPHGYVCPWVYRAEGADRGAVLRAGARLRAAPGLPDHPELARFAIAEAAQLALDPPLARFDDAWVRELRPDQIERYAELFGEILRAARRHDRDEQALVCEVLSTQPLPLRRVLEQHGIGRFRVTQKAEVGNRADVYRLENAGPADWAMVGNHDTVPIWRLTEDWVATGRSSAQALYLAARLEPDAGLRSALAEQWARDPAALAQAKLAELFAGPARNVFVFFTDAFGLRETYNVPGVISDANWSLRLTPSWQSELRVRLARDQALNVPLALATALRARGLAANHPGLVKRLDELAEATRSGARVL